jgi:hypothetical protein
MSDLNFDPNEQVVHFGRENHRPINRPQAGLLPQNKLNVRPVQRRDLCKLRVHNSA